LASISDEKLQELRDRVDLVAVVQRRVPLKKSGHDWKGSVPSTARRRPASTSSGQEMFHCFGCGVSGDAIKFVMQVEGRSFREAVEQLANEAGVDLTPPDPEEARRSARRAALAEVNEKACTFYERVLWEHPKGEIAREHLRKRGITEDTAGPGASDTPPISGFADQVPCPQGRRSPLPRRLAWGFRARRGRACTTGFVAG